MSSNLNWFDNYLKEVYPITKGKYRIPIAVTEFSIEKEKIKDIEEKLTAIVNFIKDIVFYFLDKKLEGYLIDPFRKELYLKVYENYSWKFKGVIRFNFVGNKLIEINADAVEGVIQLDITAKWFSRYFSYNGRPRYNKSGFMWLFDSKPIVVFPAKYKFVDEYYLEANLLNTEAIDEATFYEKHREIISNYNELRRAIDVDKVINIDAWLEKQNVNDILFTMMGNKANFAYLWEFADDSIKWALDIVAKTSLKPIFEEFVCKPPFGTWGEVYFNETREDCVYQELIKIPKRKIKYLDTDNSIKEDIFFYDFDPYAFYKDKLKFGNILLRFSKDKILNVAKGGGVGFYTII